MFSPIAGSDPSPHATAPPDRQGELRIDCLRLCAGTRCPDGICHGAYSGVMTRRSGPQRRHLASSPFKPAEIPEIETFDVDDQVSHQSHGLGRVVGTEKAAVTVDFGTRILRIVSPFQKLEKL